MTTHNHVTNLNARQVKNYSMYMPRQPLDIRANHSRIKNSKKNAATKNVNGLKRGTYHILLLFFLCLFPSELLRILNVTRRNNHQNIIFHLYVYIFRPDNRQHKALHRIGHDCIVTVSFFSRNFDKTYSKWEQKHSKHCHCPQTTNNRAVTCRTTSCHINDMDLCVIVVSPSIWFVSRHVS